jgi:serine/threonine-protein kinase RsbW
VLVKMQLSLPTESRYVGMMRNVAQCVMTDMGAPGEASEDVQLAVTEACANAVRHSDVNEYVVRLNVDNALCEVEVVDLGKGFDADAAIPSSMEHLEGGRGLFLMQELVDDLQFVRDGEGMHVKLTKRWTPQE